MISTGFPTTLDPTTYRTIDELARVINEVEQRVQFVKLGLVQTFPHLAIGLNVNRAMIPNAPLAGMGVSPFGIAPVPGIVGWPTSAGVQGLGHPGLAHGLGAQGLVPPISPFVAQPGVTAPIAGLGASLPSFRL